MGIDRYSKVHIYNDSDLIDYILTTKLDLEGYAFDLIYMD